MRTLLLAVLSTAVASVALALPAAPATAAPPPTLVVDCGSVNSGYKSWIGIHATNLSCAHASQTVKAWSTGCSYPKPGHTTTCKLPQHYTSHSTLYSCEALGKGGPNHYVVHCASAHNLHKVSFTYFPHGF